MDLIAEAAQTYERLGDDGGRGRSLWALGNLQYVDRKFDFGFLAAASGDFRRSRKLVGAARALEDATGARLAGITSWLMWRSEMPTGDLTPEDQASLEAEGRALALHDAIALASSLPEPADSKPADPELARATPSSQRPG